MEVRLDLTAVLSGFAQWWSSTQHLKFTGPNEQTWIQVKPGPISILGSLSAEHFLWQSVYSDA